MTNPMTGTQEYVTLRTIHESHGYRSEHRIERHGCVYAIEPEMVE
jgi:hypothetical protein